MISFLDRIQKEGQRLDRTCIETVQINVGKLCNQACLHCHVEAGPKRTEIMTEETAQRLVELLRASSGVRTVDITGGAPELNPHFRYLVDEATKLGLHVIDRCNLTVLFEPGQEGLAELLAERGVHIIASLPCYAKDNVDKQRGSGVFERSIQALRRLNDLGYGMAESNLKLDLVYNPGGAFLPPQQNRLELAYKQELRENFGIEFNRLYAMTNMPISRFLHQLERDGQYEEYMELLASSFNLAAALGVMCRSLVSVGWKGELFDCDFNQMLELPVSGKLRRIWEISSFDEPTFREIVFADHCYGCTAGAGSSCSGAIEAE